MEVKKHPLKNLSLRWSFVLYITLCVLCALALSLLLSGLFGRLQNNIMDKYEAAYHDELAKHGDIVSDGVVIQEDAVTFYTSSISDKFTEADSRLYDLYGFMAFIIVPLVSLVCILFTGFIFFRRKLKLPLAILDAASSRIAYGDLDFKVTYDSKNELGRLAASFEIMRQSLEATNRAMWKMREARKRLNAAFAHDLRTPLTVLRGYCDFLLKYVPDGKISNEKALSTISLMEVYVNRLEGYTDSMASLQKLEEIEPEPEAVPFGGLCAKIKSAANQLKGDKTFCFDARGEGELFADTSMILQVSENLISNAARFAKCKIQMSCRMDENKLIISVSDDGPGFTGEVLKNAAEPYFRGEKDESSHFGIGLYICRILCEKHGGGLTLENVPGGKVTAVFAADFKKNRTAK
jgi:signal transduction histidine kinase